MTKAIFKCFWFIFTSHEHIYLYKKGKHLQVREIHFPEKPNELNQKYQWNTTTLNMCFQRCSSDLSQLMMSVSVAFLWSLTIGAVWTCGPPHVTVICLRSKGYFFTISYNNLNALVIMKILQHLCSPLIFECSFAALFEHLNVIFIMCGQHVQ